MPTPKKNSREALKAVAAELIMLGGWIDDFLAGNATDLPMACTIEASAERYNATLSDA